MKILGNRLLVSKLEQVKAEGFQTVEIQDNFLYKGKVEQVGIDTGLVWTGSSVESPLITEGATVYFAKYSPHTQELENQGQKMKVVRLEDVIAVE